MSIFNILWKDKKNKRNVKEVNYKDININEYIILDVRSKREFKEGHLNGAINIPLADINKNVEKELINKNTKILVCCQYGIRSKKAAKILEDLGYTQIYNLKDGLENI